jgi:hypothetical protein
MRHPYALRKRSEAHAPSVNSPPKSFKQPESAFPLVALSMFRTVITTP